MMGKKEIFSVQTNQWFFQILCFTNIFDVKVQKKLILYCIVDPEKIAVPKKKKRK